MEKRETQSSTPERDSQLTEVTEQRREESANVCSKGRSALSKKEGGKMVGSKTCEDKREREREERV